MGITMNPEKLTSKFKSALNEAQSLALAKDHQFIEGIHLLSAMLEQQGGRFKQHFLEIPVLTDAWDS
jgi:ATP-dependent Clp protease ATP-binding subunit ClpB